MANECEKAGDANLPVCPERAPPQAITLRRACAKRAQSPISLFNCNPRPPCRREPEPGRKAPSARRAASNHRTLADDNRKWARLSMTSVMISRPRPSCEIGQRRAASSRQGKSRMFTRRRWRSIRCSCSKAWRVRLIVSGESSRISPSSRRERKIHKRRMLRNRPIAGHEVEQEGSDTFVRALETKIGHFVASAHQLCNQEADHSQGAQGVAAGEAVELVPWRRAQLAVLPHHRGDEDNDPAPATQSRRHPQETATEQRGPSHFRESSAL